jgi:hypothetical protein
MPERSSNCSCLRDLNQLAASIVDEATADEPEPVEPDESAAESGKNPHAAALGRLGGKKGGPARALKLSAERRSEIARRAAEARWHDAREPRQDDQ